MKPRVLLVEDEEHLLEAVKMNLELEDYEVVAVTDGEQALHKFKDQRFNLIILDVMLPRMDGYEVCEQVRLTDMDIPILFLTAKGDSNDKIKGFKVGGDDYLPKPFNPRELLARIRAVMRRKSKELPGAPSQAEGVVEFGPFKFNLATREMRKGDELLPLTSGEYAVLKVLVSHPREPLSRDKLMNQARGRDYSAMERSIDVQVSRLRRMLEDDAANPRYIQTVWGLGYVFVPDGSVN